MKTVRTRIKEVEFTQADSYDLFKPLWQIWKVQGMVLNVNEKYRWLFLLYAVFINLAVSVCYPLHLCLMLFQSNTTSDNIKNLAVAVTCVACSIKFLIYATKLPMIRTFERVLNQLDARIVEGPEFDYFRKLKRLLRNIALTFLGLYSIIGITAELSFVFSDERRLLYPAWFPFDWRKNTLNSYLANIYQIVGISCLIMQNFVDDCFPAMAFCVLSGHIKILSLRVANLGHGGNTLQENERQMIRCVLDQKRLYELYTNIEQFVSPSMFIQFTVTAFNICIGMAALIFYVTAPMDFLYYVSYTLAMPLQIFPTCYYGSEFQYRFSQLHRSIFQSNWVEQSPKFKKDMIIFTERSHKQTVAMAGGMLRIDLDTFFSTMKGAYSLFAVIMRIK